jgi:hypothetical protein
MDPTVQTTCTAITERVQDIDTPFSIDPEAGILPPGNTACFILTFAPSQVSVMWIMQLVISLVVPNIGCKPFFTSLK